MPSSDSTQTATPLAPDINAAARAERDKAIAALDTSEIAIDAQFPGMPDTDKIAALKQLNDIDRKRNAIRAAFVEEVFNSKAHQDIIKQISDATAEMSKAAEHIKQAEDMLNNVATVISYAVEVAGFFAKLAA